MQFFIFIQSFWLIITPIPSKNFETTDFSHSDIECIESFLTNRLQQVTLNGIVSVWIELEQGVPLGALVGRLLFNLYVNDLSNQISEIAAILQCTVDKPKWTGDST